MPLSWITLYPQWYAEERQRLERHYPEFWVDKSALAKGVLIYFGELKIRPPGGTVRYPIQLVYPDSTPYSIPIVIPLDSLPEINDAGLIKRKANVQLFDYRHQMPSGALCLFQHETRAIPGGDVIRGTDVLKRAEQWFLGMHTGHWPPDSVESELESHFGYATDVLLSEVFYSPELEGFGRFLMVPDLRRLWESTRENICPMIVTAVTEESKIAKVFDVRDDLARIYPWIRNDAWSPEKVAEIQNKNLDKSIELKWGYWWSLPTEPRPFHNGEGLLRELAPIASNGDAWPMVSLMLGDEIRSSSSHFFGLRYPGRYGSIQWLVLWMVRGIRKDTLLIKSDEVKRNEFEVSPIFCLRAHSVRPKDLRLRNSGVVEATIQQKAIALIGLGALGATVAELLAKAGVAKFRLCDSDTLSTGNVARHVGGLTQFGAPKTLVTMARLLEINPYLTFSQADVISGSAISSLDRLAEFVAPADLIVCTTADENTEAVINQLAVINSKVVLYGRAIRKGSMGRAFLVRPQMDACKACLAEFASAGHGGKEIPDDWIDIPESEDDILLHECGRPVIPASAIDLSFVAALIARVALDVLEGKDNQTNHWLWSRLPVPHLDPRLDKAMHTFSGCLKPRFGCPACQEPSVVHLLMSEEVKSTIVSVTEASPTTETGGILIGLVDERRQAIVVRATGPGPKAKKSGTRFSRDVEYVQAELDRAISELGPQIEYIGEWHSHLVPDPQPSPLDIESLIGIAAAPHYLTRCPVMIIAGLDLKTQKVALIGSWSFPVGGRMYSIENEVAGLDQLNSSSPPTLHQLT